MQRDSTNAEATTIFVVYARWIICSRIREATATSNSIIVVVAHCSAICTTSTCIYTYTAGSTNKFFMKPILWYGRPGIGNSTSSSSSSFSSDDALGQN